MNRLLYNISNKLEISVADYDGGNLRNAIPREAFSTIVVNKCDCSTIKKYIDIFYLTLVDEFGDLEKDLKVTFKDVELPATVMDKDSQTKFLNLINCCPHGAIAWSKEMTDLVETSTNLASAKFAENNTIKIVTTQRSSIESSKYAVSDMVESCLRLANAEVVHSDGYPGWKPNMNSEILKITRESYFRLFGKEPSVRAIHAGLECGLIYEKFKGIDMISFGPTIRGAHTPEEMIEIKTASMFWDLLIDVITRMPAK
jgi:dipeptidase D